MSVAVVTSVIINCNNFIQIFSLFKIQHFVFLLQVGKNEQLHNYSRHNLKLRHFILVFDTFIISLFQVTKTSVYDFTVTSKKTKISIRIAECRQEMEPANSDDYYFVEDPSSIIIEGAIPEPRPEPQPTFVLP